MTRLRSRNTVGFVAGIAAPLLLAPHFAAPARAADAAAPAGAICVMEFGDLSRTGDAELGALIAAGFTRSLRRSAATSVVAESDRLRHQQALRLSGAPGRAARAQLAAATGADRVVYGTITSAKVSTGTGRQAAVRLTVLVEDAQSGRLLLGAVSEGASATGAAAPNDRTALLSQAVENAAESFARYLADPAAGPRVVSETPDRRVQQDVTPPDPGARSTPLLNAEQRRQRFADIEAPAPVVVDIPGGSMDGRRDPQRRTLLSNKTLKMLVGGALFMGLIYLAGAGGFGATRPF
jgi:hypothetical protein